MNDLQNLIKMYLNYCETQKRLDVKTVKSYRIDLRQFSQYFSASIQAITPDTLEAYIATLHQTSIQENPSGYRFVRCFLLTQSRRAALKVFFLERDTFKASPFTRTTSPFVNNLAT